MLGDARHVHIEAEFDIGEARHAGDRRGIAIVRRGGERDVAFAGQEAGRRVEPDPAGAGDIDLAPRVQIGEVLVGAGRPVERNEVRLELDEISRDETRGETQIAQHLDQQPTRVAARALGEVERLVGSLHTWLRADQVADLALQARVQRDDEIDRVGRGAIDRGEQGVERRTRRFGLEVDRQIVANLFRVGERPQFGRRLDEEVERIVDGHVGNQIDLDLQFRHRLGKNVAGEVVAVGILLVIHEMAGRADLQRMAENLGPRIGRRPQPDGLRAQRNRAVIPVMGQVVEGGFDRHSAVFVPFRPQRATAGILVAGLPAYQHKPCQGGSIRDRLGPPG